MRDLDSVFDSIIELKDNWNGYRHRFLFIVFNTLVVFMETEEAEMELDEFGQYYMVVPVQQ